MLQNLGYTAVLLGVLVTVHELGHFLVAKACNVKVLRFSVGFGPALLKFHRGETEYRLAIVPLGGYVKMAGDMPYEELPPEDAARGFLAQPPWKRGLIVAAGPVFNLIFPVLVYFFVFFGAHQAESTRVGAVEPGLPAAQAGLRPGDRIVKVDGEKVETFGELRDALQPRYGKEITLTVERDGKDFTARLTPAKNVENNPLEQVTRGMIGISPVPHSPVLGVPPGSPAQAAGLQTFDRIIAVDGTPVADEVALGAALAKASGPLQLDVYRGAPLDLPGAVAQLPSKVSVRLERQPGEGYAALGAESADLYVFRVLPGSAAAKAGIGRGDRLVAMSGRPIQSFLLVTLVLNDQGDRPFELTWRSGATGQEHAQQIAQVPYERENEIGQTVHPLELGIRARPFPVEEDLKPEMITRHLGAAAAISESFKIVPDIIGKTVVVVARLITGEIPFKTVGGPILLYDMAAKSAAAGLDVYLNTLAVISVNLGIMNLLPIPILDGFHLLAALWEGIRRRPIPVRAREIANWVGLSLLVILMFFVFKNDLTR